MGSKLGWAEYQPGDTESAINSILGHVQNLNAETSDLTARIRAIFRQDNRQDPVRDRERKGLLDRAIEEILKNKNLLKDSKAGRQLQMTVQGQPAEELTQEDLVAVLREAVEIAGDRLEREAKERQRD